MKMWPNLMQTILNRLKFTIVTCSALLVVYCNQYSTEDVAINPVVLLGPPAGQTSYTDIETIESLAGGGHIIRVSAQNSELLFQGYRIYEANSEAAVQSLPASAGTDCGTMLQYPVLGMIYVMEASATPTYAGSDLLCTFPVTLTPGNYVSVRAVYLAAYGQPASTSMPSNALIVPP